MAHSLNRWAAFLAIVTACGRPPHVESAPGLGIPYCPTRAADDLLSTDALQCWFPAAHGRWRTLSHESHYAVLVVNVEAADVRDAAPIARRFVEGAHGEFSEIAVYVREGPSDGERIRRVTWTRAHGFDTLDFVPQRPKPEP